MEASMADVVEVFSSEAVLTSSIHSSTTSVGTAAGTAAGTGTTAGAN